MKGENILDVGYSVRLSFLGALSRHRRGHNDEVMVAKVTEAAKTSLYSAYMAILISKFGIGFSDQDAVRKFALDADKYVSQLAVELKRTLSQRKLSARNISFTGKVTDGRNNRLFEDMIALVASDHLVKQEINEAFVKGNGSVKVEHNGDRFTYNEDSLEQMLFKLKENNHVYPRTSAKFSPSM